MEESQFEIAASLECAQREAGVSRARRDSAPQSHPRFDGTHCVSCEEPIPAGRLALHKVRCAPCQSQMEKRHAHP